MTDAEYIELLPCPFCGSSDLMLQNLVDDDDWFVSCNGCHSQQIANYIREDAIKLWNSRAKTPVFRLKPIGAPGSPARLERDLEIAAEDAAKLRTRIAALERKLADLRKKHDEQAALIAKLVEALEMIVANRIADGGPCDGVDECLCSECIAREALALAKGK